MSIARQGMYFFIVGCCLIVLDWAVFVALTTIDVLPVTANVAGRVAGALVGFWANGTVTFSTPGSPRLGQRRLVRYLVVWVALTLLSTGVVAGLAEQLNLKIAWLAKPAVEAGMAVLSFFLSRHWVYR
ncbi:GtrA family protein [Rhodanobacter sp. UC4450_H17]